MFYNSLSLYSINVSKFNTNHVTDMCEIFSWCKELDEKIFLILSLILLLILKKCLGDTL